MPRREGITDHGDLSVADFREHRHELVMGFMEPDSEESEGTRGGGRRGIRAEPTRPPPHDDRKQDDGVGPGRQRRGRHRQADQPHHKAPRRTTPQSRCGARAKPNGHDQQGHGHKENPTACYLDHEPVHGSDCPRRRTAPNSGEATSQTSPRRGLAIVSLLCVQVEEHLLRDGDETIVTDITRFALHHLPEEQTCCLMLFRVAERLE